MTSDNWHNIFHVIGGSSTIALLINQFRKKKIYIFITLDNSMNYLKKNWPHISASLGALLTAAYQIYSTKTLTPADVALILTALGLISTTNSGTTQPPAK
jgi:hypothetical protein